MKNAKITIYTQVYNTEKYLRQCLDSVVNQTYPVHQYIVVDNGCTDGSSEIIKEYAEKYSFIEVVKNEINKRGFWYDLIVEKTTGDYIMTLDSDDWLELDYLEKMIVFLEDNNLDLALTGSLKYMDETGERKIHSPDIEDNVVLTQKEFAENFDKYHIFPAAMWGNIMKIDVYKKVDGNSVISRVKAMPTDTVFMLEYIKKCNKIGIRNDKLYNYRIRKSSITYEYNPERFPSALVYNELLTDFLKSNGVLDESYKEWLKSHIMFFFNMVLNSLMNSNASAEMKVKEVLKIFKNCVVQNALTAKLNTDPVVIFYLNIRNLMLDNVSVFENPDIKKDVEEFLMILSPGCAKAFEGNISELCFENLELWNALLNDNVLEFIKVLLDLINKTDSDDIDLAEIIVKAIPENTSISDVKRKEFFELYFDVCKLILNNNNTEALQKMIEIMLSGNELECPEDFLNVFVTLAALENHVDAFVFGNIQKAYLFIDEKRFDEAKGIVNDLVEMGLSDNEDVTELQKLLKN